MRRAVRSLALSVMIFCGTALALQAGAPCSGLYPCTSLYPAGPPLGLGPGYPGLYPPYPSLVPPYNSPWWFCPCAWILPPATIVIVQPPFCRDEPRVVVQERLVAPNEHADQEQPVRAVEGPRARKPLPGIDAASVRSSGYRSYSPLRYLHGKSYAVSDTDALSGNPEPGIIVWKPNN